MEKERETSLERALRIKSIAKQLIERSSEKVRAYFTFIGREFNEEDLLYHVSNEYSNLEVHAIENGIGIYHSRFANGWTLILFCYGKEIIAELIFSLSSSMISQEITENIKNF